MGGEELVTAELNRKGALVILSKSDDCRPYNLIGIGGLIRRLESLLAFFRFECIASNFNKLVLSSFHKHVSVMMRDHYNFASFCKFSDYSHTVIEGL